MTQSDWNKEALLIGQHIVSIYGATCEGVEIDEKTGDILVYGNDHGDQFYCQITPAEWAQYHKEVFRR